jgi:hypothetical protein
MDFVKIFHNGLKLSRFSDFGFFCYQWLGTISSKAIICCVRIPHFVAPDELQNLVSYRRKKTLFPNGRQINFERSTLI